MICNKPMKELILDIKANTTKVVNWDFLKLKEILFLPFNSIYDCIIVDNGNFDCTISENKFNHMIETLYLDKTGFEASFNEILVNNFFEEFLSISDLLIISFTAINFWMILLKEIDTKSKFCFIITVDKESKFVILRFHKFRKDECWLNDNLEKYNEPIAYVLI